MPGASIGSGSGSGSGIGIGIGSGIGIGIGIGSVGWWATPHRTNIVRSDD